MTAIISNREETPRLFQNPFLEILSKIPWWVPIAIYLPVIIYFLYISTLKVKSFHTIILFFILGVLIWTLTEYLLHRFVFHFRPKSNFGEKLVFIFHGIHHAYPKDPLRLVMPPSVSIPLAILFFYLFDLILPLNKNFPFFAGFVFGYLFYDITHYAIHHFPIRNKFFHFIKSHHMKHHFKNEKSGYGVSFPVWDYVFGTNFSD